MKEYDSISGINRCPIGNPCIAFDKLDGSNIRAEWTHKNSWSKFGTRRRMLDTTDPDFGQAIPLFLEKYSEKLEKIIKSSKEWRNCESVTAFLEFYGQSSFAGWHDKDETKELTLIDISFHKKGLITPRDFVKYFSETGIPKILYEGNFTRDFINDVKNGVYGNGEGVVAKGLMPGKKPPHSIWMAKVKTNFWLNKLKTIAAEKPEIYGSVLNENTKEQEA